MKIPASFGRWFVGMALAGLVVMSLLALLRSDAPVPAGVPNQPPSVVWLERLLYSPPDLRIDPHQGGSGTSDLLGLGLGDLGPADGSGASGGQLTVERRPHATVQVGRAYRGEVRVGGVGEIHGVQLLSGPAGLEVELNARRHAEIVWHPSEGSEGRRTVELAVLGDEASARVSYSLFVTSRGHVLGTDERGRDVLALLFRGSQWLFVSGLLAVLVGVGGGVVLGATAGFYGGMIRRGLEALLHVAEAIPALIVLFLFAVISRFNIYWVMVGVGVVMLPGVAMGIQDRVRRFREMEFVEAARELGLRDREILWREIVWLNARGLIVQKVIGGFALAVLMEVTLSFLRLGVQVPDISWGNLLLQGRMQLLSGYYWLLVPPAVVITLTIGLLYAAGRMAAAERGKGG